MNKCRKKMRICFKKLKLKKNEKERKKKKERSRKLQKPHVETEVYNNKKCEGEKKKTNLKSLIRFHSVNNIGNYNKAGSGRKVKGKKKKRKKRKRKKTCGGFISIFGKTNTIL